MINVTVESIGKRSDGNYYTRLSKVKEDELFGQQVMTGFTQSVDEPPLEEGQQIELTGSKDRQINWQA